MKIFGLTYNELVKQFKKPSIKIIFALILISAIVLPMVINKIPADMNSKNTIESNKFLLEDAKSRVDFYKDDKTQKGKIDYKYATIDRDIRQLFVDYNIGYGDWRETEANAFKNVSYELAAIEFVLEGYERNIIMEKLQNEDSDEVAKYFDLKLEKKKEIEAELIAKKELSKQIIENNDFNAHTQQGINRAKDFIVYYENKIDAYEKLKAKNPQTKDGKAELEALAKEAENAKEMIVAFEQDIQVMQFRLDNKIDYDAKNWKNNSIKAIEKNIMESRNKLLSEKEYTSQAVMQGISMTYDEYVKDFNNKNTARVDKIKELWYGLENNIPDLNAVTDARSVLDKTYEIYIILAVIMVIIIGGGIVATEFSKGTIRLLLIRPVSRWKILFSKLLALLIVGFGVVVLGIGILYVSTGATFGFETYNTPLLSTVNGAIVQTSYMSLLMPKIVLSCASLLFITSLVFAVSTLAKNTALAVAVSMVLYLGMAPLTDMLISMKQVWIINTFLPYINTSYLRLVPTASQALNEGFGLQFNYGLGATQLLIASLVILVVTFVVFTKKDVKN